MTKKNILIRADFVIYNTKSIYDTEIVKIPSYVIQDVLENNKRILITLNHENIALYTTKDLKMNLVTVEGKTYDGKFQHQDIKYNLTHVKVDLKKGFVKNKKNKKNN